MGRTFEGSGGRLGRLVLVALGAVVVGVLVVGALPRAPAATPTPILPAVQELPPRGSPVALPPAVSFRAGERAVTLTTRVVIGPFDTVDQMPGVDALAADATLLAIYPALGRTALGRSTRLTDPVLVYVGVDARVLSIQRPNASPEAAIDGPYQAVVVARATTPYIQGVRLGDEVRAPGIGPRGA